ncbi:MAG: efflux RND transporter permease subunit [Planctomycetaceae bacterium]
MIEAFVQNPVKVAVGVLLVTLFGVIAVFKMPVQLTPEVETPILRVETRWPGASPQEIEREIIQEQEEQLKSVEGLVKLTSECMDSEGRITLEFAVGTDIDDAMLKASTRLQQVREYPIDALEPVIETRNVSDSPIARFVLMAKPPSKDDVVAFQQAHPELAAQLDPVLHAMNPALRSYRLHRLYEQIGKEHPELKELLPPDIDLSKLRRFTEDVIQARLERVSGVSSAEVQGGLDEELQVVVDPEQLAARSLTITQVRDALRGQNRDTSAGDFWEGKRRWVVRTLGQFRDPDQVLNQILAIRDGRPVYVRDVAQVRLGYKKPDSLTRRYGVTSTGLSIQRLIGANVIDVMEGLRKATEELNSGVLAHRNLELYQYYDETEYIESAMGLVQENIFSATAITMIILFLFLHPSFKMMLCTPLIAASALAALYVSPWFFVITVVVIVVSGYWFGRGALVIGLAIPTSVVGTFLMLGLLGRSLNVISLAGLAFAVGTLVDNAVVVLENIHRRCQLGEPPFSAAVSGTKEVAGAVVASTLTAVAVFLPVVFVEDLSGQLFRDIALAITFAVVLSLVVSFTLIPVSAARLYKTHPADDLPATGGNGEPATLRLPAAARVIHGLLKFFDDFGRWFVHSVVSINLWVQRGVLRSLLIVGVLLFVSLAVTWALWPKVEYLPAGNRNFVFMPISPPPGYNMDQLMQMGQEIERKLKPYWDVDPNTPEAAALDYPIIDYYFFIVRNRQVFMGFRTYDQTRAGELVPLLKQVSSGFPGTISVAKQSSLFERGLTSGRTVDVEITGPDLKKLVALGAKVLGQVNGVDAEGREFMPGVQAIPQPSLDLSGPELHVTPKLVEAGDMGVNAEDLGYIVDALVDGAYAGDYFVGGNKMDLTVMGAKSFAERTQDLEVMPVATPSGQLVPLSALAVVKLSSGPEQINRRERMRAITIQVSPPPGVPLEEAMERIEREVVQPLRTDGSLDDGYMINLSGTTDKLHDAWKSLRGNFILALAITYLLMAALFESWLYPFVIILTVPLGAVGGILGLWILNLFVLQSLDVLTMLGFVILIGQVVNNPILIVHQSINHMHYDRMAPRDAIIESVRTRIRPIFITTTTNVLGLLPLVVFPGAGSELYRGLGSVVLGGQVVSTVFTLVMVPTVFILTMDAKALLWNLPQHFRQADRFEPPTRPAVERQPAEAALERDLAGDA